MAIKNLKKQSPNLKDVKFKCMDFRDIKNVANHVIYCDPPYRNTTNYNTAVFPYEEFYDWCREMSKNNIVLVSEYNIPNDFECIWELQTKVNFDSNRSSEDESNVRTEMKNI